MRRGIGIVVVLALGAAGLAAGWFDRGPGRPIPGDAAPGGGADLAGRAVLGTAERAVALRLACDPAGSGLSAALTVPDYAELGFPFDALVGPAGDRAPLSGLKVADAQGVSGVRAPASGAATAGPPAAFVLTVAGARRGEDPLRGLAAALVRPGARLTWTQASPRPDAPPLVATFPIAPGEAQALGAALGGCLGR